MAAVGAGAAIVGTGLSIFGQISGANAQSDAMQQQANLKQQQAAELLSREQVNVQIMKDQGVRADLHYAAESGSTGFAGGGVGGQMLVQKYVSQNITNYERETEFQAYMLEQGGDIESQEAGNVSESGYVGAAGTLLGATAKAYGLYQGPGKPQTLPSVTDASYASAIGPNPGH